MGKKMAGILQGIYSFNRAPGIENSGLMLQNWHNLMIIPLAKIDLLTAFYCANNPLIVLE